MIDFSLRQAVEEAKDENTKEWLKNATNLPSSEDVSFIISFLPEEFDEKANLKLKHERELRKLKERIDQLEAFNKSCIQLRDKYNEEVNRLSGANLESG